MFQIAEDFATMFPEKGDQMVSAWPSLSRQLLPLLKSVKKERNLVSSVLPEASDSSESSGITYENVNVFFLLFCLDNFFQVVCIRDVHRDRNFTHPHRFIFHPHPSPQSLIPIPTHPHLWISVHPRSIPAVKVIKQLREIDLCHSVFCINQSIVRPKVYCFSPCKNIGPSTVSGFSWFHMTMTVQQWQNNILELCVFTPGRESRRIFFPPPREPRKVAFHSRGIPAVLVPIPAESAGFPSSPSPCTSLVCMQFN